MLKNLKELNVWQKLYKLCLHIYKVTKRFPSDEMYGLTSQIKRSTVSKPSSICRGVWEKNNLSVCEVSLYCLWFSL
ncbi:MAG: four helix bundle protein [Deltaproteobacteria bacterium]|nr:four helix bundle protein [Deltaproteobacteria bacterium]